MDTTMTTLGRPALVLNKHWLPLRLAPVREAIGLVAKGAALILEPGTYRTHDLRSWDDVSRATARVGDAMIRSARLALLPPELILLRGYDGPGAGARAAVFSRRNLFKRDRVTCQYCGARPGSEELTIDHVLPRSRGGRSTWENCVLACVACNALKADRTPEEARMPLRRPPRKPSWKSLVQAPAPERRESWEAFLSRAYWDVELDP